MVKTMQGLKFYFRNGETWTINRQHIGDLWIRQIHRSFGRIHGGDFETIHPCEGLKIEIFPEADNVQTDDINLGGLELGMFSRALKYEDIEKMDFLYERGTPDQVYFPYLDKGTPGQEGLDNQYQTTKVSKINHNLYIVIENGRTVEEIYSDKF